MNKSLGFTLIELILFIVVTGILSTTILLTFINSLNDTPAVHNNVIATNIMSQCMEWYLGQRRLNDFASITTGSTVPSFCSTLLPNGFNLSVTVANTSINNDNNYKLISITVSGAGNANSSMLIADY
jgi:type II secretory pathway pseudopilin PulG